MTGWLAYNIEAYVVGWLNGPLALHLTFFFFTTATTTFSTTIAFAICTIICTITTTIPTVLLLLPLLLLLR